MKGSLTSLTLFFQEEFNHLAEKQDEKSKTYNSRISRVVSDRITHLPVCSLSAMIERVWEFSTAYGRMYHT